MRDIAVLFVDVIGSTSLAENCPPEEVVGLLNQFFEVVVEVVHDHGGFINKFEGDAALAVWGAPMAIDDIHTCSLQAARVLAAPAARRRSATSGPSIGVSGGRAVAGNVGTHERYEYTVIGDPVNEAARLTTAAKETDAPGAGQPVAGRGGRGLRGQPLARAGADGGAGPHRADPRGHPLRLSSSAGSGGL